MWIPSVLRFFILLMPLACLLSCGEQSNTSKEQIRPVKAMLIGNGKAFNNRSFPGKARATQEVNLSFNENGSLIELPINIGDKVKKGALLAKLDPREFEAKLKAATAEMTRDQHNFLRAKELVKKGHISKSDYDLLEAKFSVSQSNLDLASKAMTDSVLKAPFDGQIADLYVKNYQTVAKQQVIARLLDSSQIEMVIQIPESAISYIPQAIDITVQFDAFPKYLITARIKEVSNEASPDTRTYPVTLIMQQPQDIQILPGMAGKARGKIAAQGSPQENITIPLSALITQKEDNKSYVWIVDPKTHQVHQQAVTLGELTSNGVSISEGLDVNLWVVTAGANSLKEGQKVSILNQKDK